MWKIFGLVVAMSFFFATATAEDLWKTLDFPGASHTCITGISGDKIVGWYGEPRSHHGFVYNGKKWTTLDAPESQDTMIAGISGDNLAGSYRDKSDVSYGFIYNNGSWTVLNVPKSKEAVQKLFREEGKRNTRTSRATSGGRRAATKADILAKKSVFVEGICDKKIVGWYSDGKKYHGLIYDIDEKEWTTLDSPDAENLTHVTGISGDKVVGWYDDGRVSRQGFVYEKVGESWTTLKHPDARSLEPAGISGDIIVGSYRDIRATHGFVYDGNNWTKLDARGARKSTQAKGMAENKIFGCFSDGDATHGFIYTWAKVE